ncbi:MAG: LamG domain-containing protein, partial [Verrucomicrobiota bacterium]
VITNSFTVMCWAKGNLGSWQAFVTKGGDFGTGWALREGGSGGIACWTLRATGGNEDMQGSISHTDGKWHFYAGTFDVPSSNRSLYVDGVLEVQQTNQVEYADSGGHLTFGTEDRTPGNNFGNNGYFTGELYGVRIYSVALTPAQLNSFMTWAAPGVPAFSGGAAAASTGPAGSQLVLTWNSGFLFQAPSVMGPWTPTGATSPYTNITTNAQMFFRLVNP